MFRAGSTAAARATESGYDAVSDIVFPADCGKTTGFTAKHVVGRGREVATLNRRDGVREPLLCVGQHITFCRFRGEQRDDALRPLEGDVHRLDELPRGSIR